MRFHPGIFLILLFLGVSCQQDRKAGKQYTYFDIEGYFKKEAARLQKLNPSVDKTVSKSRDSEERTVKIGRWDDELELFTESDINKPAWKNSYRTVRKPNEITYISLDSNLRTRSITIRKSSDSGIREITIRNRVNNTLYSSDEQLTYYPDSLYRILKSQNVRFIGVNNYSIAGKIKKAGQS